MQFMGLQSKRYTLMFRENKLYRTYELFARLKGALVAASAEKWARIPDIKDYVRPRRYAFSTRARIPDVKDYVRPWRYAFSTMYRNCKIDFAVAFDDIKSCISEVKAIDPEAFITDYRFLYEVYKITQINPKNPIGWIAAVMICKFAGNIKKARDLIQQGCVECPNNELVWLEAAELEVGNANKSKVLIQGLEKIPNSGSMWKAFAEQLANKGDARLLLQRALQLSYGSAIRSAINKLKKVARKIDDDEEILELAIRYVLMRRRSWNLKDEAEFVEPAAFVATCQAIIPNTNDSWECHLIKMALSGNDQREARLEQESKKDSKRKLHSIFDDDWNSSPKDGDYSSWNKKRVKCSEPVPDTVQMYGLPTVGEARGSEVASTSDCLADLNLLDENDPSQLIQEGKLHSISDDNWNSSPRVGDYSPLNKNRFMELASKLDAIPIQGSTAVDREVYLADLNLMDEIRSDIQVNPKDPRSWIAAARRAKSAGMIHEARQLIKEALKMFPKNEDVWLEECWLAKPDKAKCVIAKGLKMNPKSEKLWMQAAKLEHVNVKKIMVLTKGLDNIPGSLILKNAVEEPANEDNANI